MAKEAIGGSLHALAMKFIKFGVVGASGMVIHGGLLFLLKEVAGTNPFIANPIGLIAAASSNYFLNRIWTFHSKEKQVGVEYVKFILVSIIFPNIHLLRPETMPEDSVLTKMVSLLYMADTPTNLTPSIHVFNSLGIMAAAWEWDWRTDSGYSYSGTARGFWRMVITVLGILIILSTMMIKQHSFSDVVIALGFFFFTYVLVYRFDFMFIGGKNVRRPALRPRSARS